MSKRVALYARVSTEDQARYGYSLPSQLEACRKYAEERGWTVVAEVSEDGVSGATLDRPGLDRIRDMAQAKRIDAVIVYDLDRLSRKAVYQMLIDEELGKAGVTIHYVLGNYRDDDEGRLQKQIRAAIAEYERAKIRERMERGKRSKARQGLVVGAGRIPYGYRYDGNGHLVIVEEEAHVVRLIFKWYTNDNLSIREITRRLSAMGFRTYQGNTQWAHSTVHRILTNETYAGTAYYNRLKRENPYSKRRIFRPREAWIPIKVPAIVDRGTWEAAQRRLTHSRKMVRRRARHRYLLSGMLICAECGYAYSGEFAKGKRYYRDGGRKHPNLRADEVEEKVWEAVKGLLLNPATLWEGYKARENAVMEQKARLTKRLETILRLKKRAEQKLEVLTDTYLDPQVKMNRAEYIRHRRKIEKEIAAWAQEAAEVRKQLKMEVITKEQMEDIERFAAKVSKGINYLSFEEKRKILQMLEVRGIVHHQDNGVWIQLYGLFPPTGVGISSIPFSWSAPQGRVRPSWPAPSLPSSLLSPLRRPWK